MSEGIEAKGKRIFWGNENVLYLHCGYMTLCVSQKSKNCTLKRVDFTVYALSQ